MSLRFANDGQAAAVFHVYDRLNLAQVPRRYTIEAGRQLEGSWEPDSAGDYDLWVLGPNGFHRHFTGSVSGKGGAWKAGPEVDLAYDVEDRSIVFVLRNEGSQPCVFELRANAYYGHRASATQPVMARSEYRIRRSLRDSAQGYDFSVGVAGQHGFSRRFAGRMEVGEPSISDPVMEGAAQGEQVRVDARPGRRSLGGDHGHSEDHSQSGDRGEPGMEMFDALKRPF